MPRRTRSSAGANITSSLSTQGIIPPSALTHAKSNGRASKSSQARTPSPQLSDTHSGDDAHSVPSTPSVDVLPGPEDHPTFPTSSKKSNTSTFQSTPITNKMSGMATYTTGHYERDPRLERLGAEMTGKFVGPMPVDEFLENFLPHPNRESISKGQLRLLEMAKSQTLEVDVYPFLVRPRHLFLLYFLNWSRPCRSRPFSPLPRSSRLLTVIVIRT